MMRKSTWIVRSAGAVLVMCALAEPSVAQVTVVPNKAPPNAASTATPSGPVPAAARSRSAPRACMRLPLSDIQFGREYTIQVAREKLEDYARKEAARRGWKNGFTRSNETATCEDYLWLPIGGQEYKCLVTATFCQK